MGKGGKKNKVTRFTGTVRVMKTKILVKIFGRSSEVWKTEWWVQCNILYSKQIWRAEAATVTYIEWYVVN